MISEAAFLDLGEEAIPWCLITFVFGSRKGWSVSVGKFTRSSVLAHVYIVCFVSLH